MSEAIEKVWKILSGVHVCMLIDRFQAGLRARPMGLQLDEGSNALWFVTDHDSGKVDEVRRNPEVCVSVQDGTTYVSITGDAEIVEDRARLRELWNTAIDAWYPEGPDGPKVTLLKVSPRVGEYWDGPGKLVSGVKMLFASVADRRPDMGDNEKVTFSS